MYSELLISKEHGIITFDNEKDFYALKERNLCFVREYNEPLLNVTLGYFAGVDWIDIGGKAFYVEPKLNGLTQQTNYLLMLFDCLGHQDVMLHTDGLFAIDFQSPQIRIKQNQDLLTPLLIIQFLQIVKAIVRKGLKKSYNRVEENLNARIKGKLLVTKTIKQNLVKNRKFNSFCSFDEFSINTFENRLLKKTLLFIQHYLQLLKIPGCHKHVTETFNYIMPSFASVSDDVDINAVKQFKANIFYKDYEVAIKLAKLILKKFGYNISTIKDNEIVSVPPFWINMAKLFELYVLGLLKDRFAGSIKYHFYREGNELDYLINSVQYKMVIDAKYKTLYAYDYEIADIRQVSGYARMKDVYRTLSKDAAESIDCLIIYPDKNGYEKIDRDLKSVAIESFTKIYKYPLKLPLIS